MFWCLFVAVVLFEKVFRVGVPGVSVLVIVLVCVGVCVCVGLLSRCLCLL